jgi:hypothetical protein
VAHEGTVLEGKRLAVETAAGRVVGARDGAAVKFMGIP